ncbi:MAG: hypothetical protein VW455_00495 [Nitrospinota bacterium]
MKLGWVRLAIVAAVLLILVLLIPSLKIYHFSPFNSGVSAIIALVAGVWVIYSIFIWVMQGFRK